LRRPNGDPFLALAAFAGLVAFGVHNLFHFPTAAGTILALTLGAILSRQSEAKAEQQSPGAAIPVSRGLAVGAVAAGLLYVFVLEPLRADVLCRAGTTVTLTDPPLAVAYGREAVRLDASRDLLWLRLAAAYEAAARTEREPLARKRLFEDGRRAAEEAVRLVPSSAYGQAQLGTLLGDLERESPALAGRAEVEQAFARGRDLDPNNSFIHVAAATAALAAGDRERAVSWAGLCSRLYPRFAPPRALLGAASLAAGRELLAAGQKERARIELERAVALLREAHAGEWREDEAARAAARANRDAAMRALAALE
jgi:tetratricopeptide (TPR) repeat protein